MPRERTETTSMKQEDAMGLVYFGVVTVALLIIERLIAYEGSFGKPTRPQVGRVAHATN